jgi:hypothetical protein
MATAQDHPELQCDCDHVRANYGLRYIYIDGRTLPSQGSVQPFWYGYSVGRWEGDTLVVETNNLRGAETGPYDGWLDVRGSPYTDQARFIERIRRPTYGKLEIDVTLDDSKAYTKPFHGPSQSTDLAGRRDH